jgi:Zn finger protein HypA/HybF involved in hydrogenase expression
MYEKELVQEIMTLIRTHMTTFSTERPPKVTIKIPNTLATDMALFASLFEEKRQGTTFENATLCVDSCSASIYCHDCGRQYRGPFLFDLCQRCRGEHFESDDHLQMSVEAFDRRAPHKPKKGKWQVTIPAC